MALKDQIERIRNYFIEDDEDEVEVMNQPSLPPQPQEEKPVQTPSRSSRNQEVREENHVQTVENNNTEREQIQSRMQKQVVQPKRTPVQQPVVNASKALTVPSKIAPTIAIKEPKAYADIMDVGRIVRNGESVLINFKFMSDDTARRSIDFMTGVAFTVDGDIQNVGGQIFLMTPANVVVDAEKELSILANQSFDQFDLAR